MRAVDAGSAMASEVVVSAAKGSAAAGSAAAFLAAVGSAAAETKAAETGAAGAHTSSAKAPAAFGCARASRVTITPVDTRTTGRCVFWELDVLVAEPRPPIYPRHDVQQLRWRFYSCFLKCSEALPLLSASVAQRLRCEFRALLRCRWRDDHGRDDRWRVDCAWR